ncbi:transporter substrate-binding domain-containing protein [Anaerohalosphaera lusitana]|uniref:transporter substrate-binding domain-containing protein n=1 Tax=Anaerohalosphaera lusitana TaxID=1936003 RepID=UPI001473B20A|nr:transporter substrate-binding domain-containing protein [Anaerohalosphaera lusitana]
MPERKNLLLAAQKQLLELPLNLIRFTLAVLIAIAFCAGIGGCREEQEDFLTSEERVWLEEHKNEIRVTYAPYWAPMTFTDEPGNASGYCADVFRLIEKKLGVQFERVRSETWPEALRKVRADEADVVMALATNCPSRDYLLYTESYMDTPVHVIIREEYANFFDLSEIKDIKAAVEVESAAVDLIKAKHPELELERVINTVEGMKGVAEGRYDALITDIGVATYYISKLGLDNLRSGGEVGFSYKTGIGSTIRLPMLNSILEKGLDQISPQEMDRLQKKWLGGASAEREGRARRRGLVLSSVFVFAIIVLGAIIILLRRAKARGRNGAEKAGRVIKIITGLIILVLLASAALLVFFQISEQDISLTPEEKAWLRRHDGEIRVSGEPYWAPISFIDEGGRMRGIGADVLRKIEKEFNFEFVTVVYDSWSEVLESAREKKIDVVNAINRTQKRSAYLNFTECYIRVPTIMICREGLVRRLKPEELVNYRVGVMRDSALAGYLETEFAEIDFVAVSDNVTLLSMVSFGELDVGLINSAAASYYINEMGLSNLDIVGKTGFEYELSIGCRADEPILVSIMEKGLQSISDKEMDALLDKWVYVELRPWHANKEIIIVASIAAIMILAGAATVLFWNYNLRRVVESKTAELEKELAERKKGEKEREELMRRLEAKNDEMESVIYVSSHDLRSPMVNIDGFSSEIERCFAVIKQVLEDERIPDDIRAKIDPMLEEDVPVAIGFIKNSTAKMDGLMKSLLKLSRLGRAAMEIERLDMNELIENILKGMHYQISSKGVSVEVEDLPCCWGDRAQINQVFTNLIDNAIKYLPDDREGIVKVTGWEEEHRGIYCVADNGVGISESQQQKVFEIFHRIDPDHPASGEGMGLAIVRRIVDKHGGHIWVESEEGQGSQFYVSLPHVQEPAEEAGD